MLEKRTFEKGMNNDAAIELVDKGQYSYALNMSLHNDGLMHITLGNTEITDIDIPLPTDGENIVIGDKENLTNNCVYYFLYNSEGNNRILRFNRTELSITTLMLEAFPFILNFNPDYLITSIDFFYLDSNNLMIYWTDNYNPPRKINERRALGFMNRWIFTDNFFSGGYVAFVGNSEPPFVVGDKIKVEQDFGFTNSQYNNYAIVTDISGNIVTTDLVFGVSTPPQGGYIVYSNVYASVDQQTIDRIKWPPIFNPQATGKNDPSFTRNNIGNNLG